MQNIKNLVIIRILYKIVLINITVDLIILGSGVNAWLGVTGVSDVCLSVGGQGHVVLHPQVVQYRRVLVLHILVTNLRRMYETLIQTKIIFRLTLQM